MELRGSKLKEAILSELKEKNVDRKLSFLLLGNPLVSEGVAYLNSIIKTLTKLNIPYQKYLSTSYAEIEDKLANSENFTSIVIARPLQIENEDKLIELIPAEKDADMLTTFSRGKLIQGDSDYLPATARSAIILLKSLNIDLVGKRAVVIGRSISVGYPIFLSLVKMNLTATLIHSKTTKKDIESLVKEADVLVLATGQKVVKKEDIKDGSIIIDCGYNSEGLGDLRFIPNNATYTPVPGGVGPLTIVSLVQNALLLYEHLVTSNL